MWCPYRGRESFTAGGATEVGGASAAGCGGGMTAEMYDRRKKNNSIILYTIIHWQVTCLLDFFVKYK